MIIHCVALNTVCQVTQLNGKFCAFNLEKFTPGREIHTGAASGACNKYQVLFCHTGGYTLEAVPEKQNSDHFFAGAFLFLHDCVSSGCSFGQILHCTLGI